MLPQALNGRSGIGEEVEGSHDSLCNMRTFLPVRVSFPGKMLPRSFVLSVVVKR